MRGVSTVLDATLFLLLVSAAAIPLVTTDEGPTTSDAPDRTLEVLTTATAEFTYATGNASAGVAGEESSMRRRTAHGTLAELLAAAAVDRPTVGPAATDSTDFDRAVTVATRDAVQRTGVQTQVRVHWQPYPDAPLSGGLEVGPDPPSNADVHAASTTVPSGFPVVAPAAASAAREDGYEGVASAVAAGLVEALFPVRRTRLTLARNGTAAERTRTRYRRVAGTVGVTVPEDLRTESVSKTNRRIHAALADRVERDLRAAYDEPTAAARAVAVGEVRLVVRTWSP